jgi:hypothetical protein
VPDLGDQVLALMPEPLSGRQDEQTPDAIKLPGAVVGEAPWT